jgi:Tfp pilus assembly protein PilE
MQREDFSLVETIAVIAIVCILSAIVLTGINTKNIPSTVEQAQSNAQHFARVYSVSPTVTNGSVAGEAKIKDVVQKIVICVPVQAAEFTEPLCYVLSRDLIAVQSEAVELIRNMPWPTPLNT